MKQILQTEINIFKNRNTRDPGFLHGTIVNNIHRHATHSLSNIAIDYRRTDYGKFSLKFRGTQIWNNLPIDLKKIENINL